jgi:sugar phosphate isomerase/epimerase
MLWGYAGVFPGEFNIWDGDQTMNKLQFMVDNGFDSCSMRLDELDEPERRDQVGAFIAEHGLKVTAHPSVRWMDPDTEAVRRQVDASIEKLERYQDVLNAPITTFAAGPVHRFMDEPDLEWQLDRLADVTAPLARACHELGCPLGIENHGDYYCRDLVDLCERVPHLGIFLDTGNTYLIGEQSVPNCRLAAPYTIGTHLKDHRVHPEPKGGLRFVIEGAPLGAGHVGLEQIYQDLLALHPAPEKLVMQWEMIPPKDMDAWDCLEQSWDFVRDLIDKYGEGEKDNQA